MNINRRKFLSLAGIFAGTAIAGSSKKARADVPVSADDSMGVLVDTTYCIGCRKCEQACNDRHDLPLPDRSFEDLSILENARRPDEKAYTVINRYNPGHKNPRAVKDPYTYVKFQCMHCLDPACASACITGAMSKTEEGPVVYNSSKCIGCRYCMVACPFQIPAYEYDKALTPRVMKCTLCFEYTREGKGLPACAQICPAEVMLFGKRSELLEIAKYRIKSNPGKYFDHVYGEHEVGGTSWLYIASEPLDHLGFPELGNYAPPRLTETIQHTIFQGLAGPIILFGLLGGIMGLTNRRRKSKDNGEVKS